MSDFSDEQDRALIQLVLQNQSHSIDWDAVTVQFPRAPRTPRKTKLALRRRLETLKRTYGRDLSRFPRRLLGQPNTTRTVQRPHSTSNATTSRVNVHSFQELSTCKVSTSTTATVSYPSNQDMRIVSASTVHTASVSSYQGIQTTTAATVSYPSNQDMRTVSASTVHTASVSSYQGIQTTSTVGTHPTSLTLQPAITDDQLDTLPTRGVCLVRRSKPLPKSPSVSLVRRTTPLLTWFVNAISDQATPAVTNTLDEHDAYLAIDRIFANVSRVDVSQPSGAPSQNSGEILPIGVTKMIEAMNVMSTDVFGDIGSGTGSVLAQVALQTNVQRCVGLEIRSALANQSLSTLRSFYQAFPRLSRVAIHFGDIKHLMPQVRTELETCTILLCNNFVFAPRDNQAVQDFILTSRNARLVLLTERFCPRCRGGRCPNPFCHEWEIEHNILKIRSSWRAAPVDMFVYHRRYTSVAESMTDILEDMSDEDDI
jgi:Histone methylation protein DOT1